MKQMENCLDELPQKYSSDCTFWLFPCKNSTLDVVDICIYTYYHNHLIAFHSVMKMTVNVLIKNWISNFILPELQYISTSKWGFLWISNVGKYKITIFMTDELSEVHKLVLWFLDLSATFMNWHYIFLAQCDISLLIDITFLLRNFPFSTPWSIGL